MLAWCRNELVGPRLNTLAYIWRNINRHEIQLVFFLDPTNVAPEGGLYPKSTANKNLGSLKFP